MSRYTLWDIPSSTLLLETRELDVIAESTTRFILDNGEEALSDLMLGIEPDDSSEVHDHSGMHILDAIAGEQGAVRVR